MNLHVKRLPDTVYAAGGIVLDDENPDDSTELHPVSKSSLRFQFQFDKSELTEDEDGGMTATWYATQETASEFAGAIVDCLCDA